MKTITFFSGALTVTLLVAGLQSCNKDRKSNPNPASGPTEVGSTKSSSRMGAPWRRVYAVGNTPSNATLYEMSLLPGLTSASAVSDFSVGTTPVTEVTGLAYNNDNQTMIISTGPTSNYPNSILTYPYPIIGTALTSPVVVSCANITDIEYNEYDRTLYGIFAHSQIVSIAPSGFTTVDLSPTIPPGRKLTGLCNYNALLSYCISDGTPASDDFYSYGPGGIGPLVSFLFSTDWDGSGSESQSVGGGTQYVDAVGWQIVTANCDNKLVDPSGIPGPFTAIAVPAPVIFTDVTSE
jgi:hypothetical protein